MEIYLGIVKEIDPKTCKVKIQIPDLDNVITDWLPVKQTNTLGALSFNMPREDQLTYAHFLDEHMANGYIAGGRYSEKDQPPPDLDAKDFYLELEDGTKIHIKEDTILLHTPRHLEAKTEATATLEAKGAVSVTTQSTANLEAQGAITAKTQATATLEAAAQITLKAPQITLDAPMVKMTGALEVALTIKDIDVISTGKSFLAHTHLGNLSAPTSPPL